MEDRKIGNADDRSLPPLITRLLVVAFGVVFIVASVVWGKDHLLPDGLAVIGAGAVILGLVFPYLTSLKLPGGFEANFRKLQQDVRVNADRISRIILLAMSPEVLAHLRNLRQGGKILETYSVDPWVVGELEHLRNVGYIRMTRSGTGIRDIPTDRPVNLAEFVKLTPLGEEYLSMRDQVEREREEGAIRDTPNRP
jgi:hypothetical protein